MTYDGNDDDDGGVRSFYDDMNAMRMMMFLVMMKVMLMEKILIFDVYAGDADRWN